MRASTVKVERSGSEQYLYGAQRAAQLRRDSRHGAGDTVSSPYVS